MFHFYCYNNERKIVISDQPVEKVKDKFGFRYEILNSIKDKESLDIVKERVLRSYPNFKVVEFFFKPRKKFSEETKRKMSLAKIGKPRDKATCEKISKGLKGRSNFQGKKHTEETKKIMSEKKLGNKHVKDLIWAHDPNSNKEVRVKERSEIPEGFLEGRDYDAIENGTYAVREWNLATKPPKDKQSNTDPLLY